MNRTLLSLALVAASGLVSGLAFAQHSTMPARDIDKVNGNITAQAGQAYGDLSTVNGGIDLERGTRAEDVETVNGGIEAGADVAAGDVSTVNGGIRFGQRARIAGSVETVNGGIYVDRGSRVQRGVATVNGAIGLVDTDVGGEIETVNGDVTVGAGSSVKGGIHVEKPGRMGLQWGKQRVPRIVIGPGAVVEGPLVFDREVVLYVHASARTGAIRGAVARRYEGERAPRD
jgi:DUF4097 and DUF4098 domain-containing protein YvlB